jgi:hypothetical protein
MNSGLAKRTADEGVVLGKVFVSLALGLGLVAAVYGQLCPVSRPLP